MNTKSKLTEEQKIEKTANKAAEKAEKARVREEKRAAKAAATPGKHTAKLMRVKGQLPKLSLPEQKFYDDVVAGCTPDELERIASHLSYHVREEQTKRAVAAVVEVGQTVRIRSGNQRYTGLLGTVSRANRIRCYVNIPNVDKDIYLFTSDVESVDQEFISENDSSENDFEVTAVAV